jgi:hypothetical protein
MDPDPTRNFLNILIITFILNSHLVSVLCCILTRFVDIFTQFHELVARLASKFAKICYCEISPQKAKWSNWKIFDCVHCANNVVLGYVSFSSNYLATLSTDSKSSPKNNLGWKLHQSRPIVLQKQLHVISQKIFFVFVSPRSWNRPESHQ